MSARDSWPTPHPPQGPDTRRTLGAGLFRALPLRRPRRDEMPSRDRRPLPPETGHSVCERASQESGQKGGGRRTSRRKSERTCPHILLGANRPDFLKKCAGRDSNAAPRLEVRCSIRVQQARRRAIARRSAGWPQGRRPRDRYFAQYRPMQTHDATTHPRRLPTLVFEAFTNLSSNVRR
jgi:hypothetical protein